MNAGPPRVRVLIVCSEVRACDALARYLQNSGIDAEVAIGAAEAMGVLDEQAAIIIYLDGPRSPVEALVLAVRSRHPRTRILGLGDIALDSIGPDAVFPLPVDPERIVNWING